VNRYLLSALVLVAVAIAQPEMDSARAVALVNSLPLPLAMDSLVLHLRAATWEAETTDGATDHDIVRSVSVLSGGRLRLKWWQQEHTIPDLEGKTWPDAEKLLAAAGFSVWDLSKPASDKWDALQKRKTLRVRLSGEPTGVIRDQSIKGAVYGLPLVVLTFGAVGAVEGVMPNLRGKTWDEARKVLEDNGFTLMPATAKPESLRGRHVLLYSLQGNPALGIIGQSVRPGEPVSGVRKLTLRLGRPLDVVGWVKAHWPWVLAGLAALLLGLFIYASRFSPKARASRAAQAKVTSQLEQMVSALEAKKPPADIVRDFKELPEVKLLPAERQMVYAQVRGMVEHSAVGREELSKTYPDFIHTRFQVSLDSIPKWVANRGFDDRYADWRGRILAMCRQSQTQWAAAWDRQIQAERGKSQQVKSESGAEKPLDRRCFIQLWSMHDAIRDGSSPEQVEATHKRIDGADGLPEPVRAAYDHLRKMVHEFRKDRSYIDQFTKEDRGGGLTSEFREHYRNMHSSLLRMAKGVPQLPATPPGGTAVGEQKLPPEPEPFRPPVGMEEWVRALAKDEADKTIELDTATAFRDLAKGELEKAYNKVLPLSSKLQQEFRVRYRTTFVTTSGSAAERTLKATPGDILYLDQADGRSELMVVKWKGSWYVLPSFDTVVTSTSVMDCFGLGGIVNGGVTDRSSWILKRAAICREVKPGQWRLFGSGELDSRAASSEPSDQRVVVPATPRPVDEPKLVEQVVSRVRSEMQSVVRTELSAQLGAVGSPRPVRVEPVRVDDILQNEGFLDRLADTMVERLARRGSLAAAAEKTKVGAERTEGPRIPARAEKTSISEPEALDTSAKSSNASGEDGIPLDEGKDKSLSDLDARAFGQIADIVEELRDPSAVAGNVLSRYPEISGAQKFDSYRFLRRMLVEVDRDPVVFEKDFTCLRVARKQAVQARYKELHTSITALCRARYQAREVKRLSDALDELLAQVADGKVLGWILSDFKPGDYGALGSDAVAMLEALPRLGKAAGESLKAVESFPEARAGISPALQERWQKLRAEAVAQALREASKRLFADLAETALVLRSGTTLDLSAFVLPDASDSKVTYALRLLLDAIRAVTSGSTVADPNSLSEAIKALPEYVRSHGEAVAEAVLQVHRANRQKQLQEETQKAFESFRDALKSAREAEWPVSGRAPEILALPAADDQLPAIRELWNQLSVMVPAVKLGPDKLEQEYPDKSQVVSLALGAESRDARAASVSEALLGLYSDVRILLMDAARAAEQDRKDKDWSSNDKFHEDFVFWWKGKEKYPQPPADAVSLKPIPDGLKEDRSGTYLAVPLSDKAGQYYLYATTGSNPAEMAAWFVIPPPGFSIVPSKSHKFSLPACVKPSGGGRWVLVKRGAIEPRA
jgi:hypothetical protein